MGFMGCATRPPEPPNRYFTVIDKLRVLPLRVSAGAPVGSCFRWVSLNVRRVSSFEIGRTNQPDMYHFNMYVRGSSNTTGGYVSTGILASTLQPEILLHLAYGQSPESVEALLLDSTSSMLKMVCITATRLFSRSCQ